MRLTINRAVSRLSIISFLFFVLLSTSARADRFFETKRYSYLTPEHCQEFNLNFFNQPINWVTYSIDGAVENGFTNAVRLSRHEAAQMWRLLREFHYISPDPRWPITQDPRTAQILSNLETARKLMGFTYGSEGEVLEALALMDLAQYYDPKEYFFTGGIEYSRGAGRVLGELDIVVARRSDCAVVVVGESKLGLHRLRKAHEQLARFGRFLKTKGGKRFKK